IPEYKIGGDKISGRNIRKEIVSNNLKIPVNVKKLLPDFTVNILEEEFEKGHLPGRRDAENVMHRLNNYSRSKLLNLAHINADAVNELVKGRRYRLESQVWASLRKAGYGPVLSRLAICAVEQDVTKMEVFNLLAAYENKGIIPPDMTRAKVIERAWYVSSQSSAGISSSEAHKDFQKGKTTGKPPLHALDAGLHLRSFEVDSLKTDMEASIFVDKRGDIACQILPPGRKIKSPLKLPANQATYLRLLIDSHFIPLKAKVVKKKAGFRIRIEIGG
ncbi:MAG TPA: cytidyltransferase, partial [Methanobacterium sp.]|nr:cytidyltransferase [Methanobacterium sp.]